MFGEDHGVFAMVLWPMYGWLIMPFLAVLPVAEYLHRHPHANQSTQKAIGWVVTICLVPGLAFVLPLFMLDIERLWQTDDWKTYLGLFSNGTVIPLIMSGLGIFLLLRSWRKKPFLTRGYAYGKGFYFATLSYLACMILLVSVYFALLHS